MFGCLRNQLTRHETATLPPMPFTPHFVVYEGEEVGELRAEISFGVTRNGESLALDFDSKELRLLQALVDSILAG